MKNIIIALTLVLVSTVSSSIFAQSSEENIKNFDDLFGMLKAQAGFDKSHNRKLFDGLKNDFIKDDQMPTLKNGEEIMVPVKAYKTNLYTIVYGHHGSVLFDYGTYNQIRIFINKNKIDDFITSFKKNLQYEAKVLTSTITIHSAFLYVEHFGALGEMSFVVNSSSDSELYTINVEPNFK